MSCQKGGISQWILQKEVYGYAAMDINIIRVVIAQSVRHANKSVSLIVDFLHNFRHQQEGLWNIMTLRHYRNYQHLAKKRFYNFTV